MCNYYNTTPTLFTIIIRHSNIIQTRRRTFHRASSNRRRYNRYSRRSHYKRSRQNTRQIRDNLRPSTRTIRHTRVFHHRHNTRRVNNTSARTTRRLTNNSTRLRVPRHPYTNNTTNRHRILMRLQCNRRTTTHLRNSKRRTRCNSSRSFTRQLRPRPSRRRQNSNSRQSNLHNNRRQVSATVRNFKRMRTSTSRRPNRHYSRGTNSYLMYNSNNHLPRIKPDLSSQYNSLTKKNRRTLKSITHVRNSLPCSRRPTSHSHQQHSTYRRKFRYTRNIVFKRYRALKVKLVKANKLAN